MTTTWRQPRLRPEITLGPAMRSGTTVVHHVKDARTGWYYRVGPREHFLMSRMDGARTVAEIGAEYADRFDRRLADQHWQQLFALLGRRQMLAGAADEAALDRLAGAYRDSQAAARSGLRRRWPLFAPDRLCAVLAAGLRWCYRPWAVLPALLAVVLMEAYVLTHLEPLGADMRAGPGLGWTLPLASVLVWLTVCVHELAHGVTCRHFGGTVAEIGLMWRFLMLAPYCKVDDIVLFPRRRQRVYTAFAGMFGSLLALLPFLVVWAATPAGGVHAVCAGALVVGSLTTLVNLVPFLQLDGYAMLGNALGMADLRQETYRWWRAALRREAAGYRRADRRVYLLYGLASVLCGAAAWAGLLVVWYRQLAGWFGGPAAAIVLAAETAVLLALVAAGLAWAGRKKSRA
jgi:putative peptide zinc metalloprotease protein